MLVVLRFPQEATRPARASRKTGAIMKHVQKLDTRTHLYRGEVDNCCQKYVYQTDNKVHGCNSKGCFTIAAVV